LTDRFAIEQGKRVALVTMGLEEIPESPGSGTFCYDLLGALTRKRRSEANGIRSTSGCAPNRPRPDMAPLVGSSIDRGTQGFRF